MRSRKLDEKQVREFIRNYADEPLIITPNEPTVVIRRVCVPGKVCPYNLSSVEFERLYKFFESVFEKECPGHSEQIVHAYVIGQIETIKVAREAKAAKDEYERVSNWGGW